VLLAVGHRGRRENRVHSNLNRVLHHRGDQPRNVGRRELQTRVRVDLNQPRVHVLVNHEVVSKYFPGVLAPTRVHLPRNRLHRVLHQLLELGQHRLHEVALNAHRVEVLLEIGVRKLISVFKFAVVRAPILNRVISQMDQAILHILDIVFAAGRSQIAVLVEVALKVAIHTGRHGEKPDVELSTFVEQGSLTVLLYNKRPFFAVYHVVLHDLFNLREFPAHRDSTPTICVLTWLHDPELFAHRRELMHGFTLLGRIVNVLELSEGAIRNAFLDVERQRHIIERILANRFVINLHVVVDRLLIR